MWRAAAGQQIKINEQSTENDEWETDPDFVNNVNEHEQRWGSATVAGSGRTAGAIDMTQLRKETEEADAMKKKKQLMEDPSNPSFGYGGKFGIQKDRMDQSAVGHEYIAIVEKHASQKDYSSGFGGKFGIQTDRIDKSAVSWEHKEKVEKHASQKDYATGFGGKFGIQTDRQDKSAVGWDHIEKVEKHESQRDYARGFGGKFGIQSDRQDKSALGWDHHEEPQKHESQTDHKIGFGGKFGLQTDRVDKSAASFSEEPTKAGSEYTKVKPDIGNAKPADLRAKFEYMSSQEKQGTDRFSIPRKAVHAKAASFMNKNTEKPLQSTPENSSKMVSSSETILTQNLVKETRMNNDVAGQFSSKVDQFNNQISTIVTDGLPLGHKSKIPLQEEALKKFISDDRDQDNLNNQLDIRGSIAAKENLQQLMKTEQGQVIEEEIYENLNQTNSKHTSSTEEEHNYTADEIVDTGISATALYDYQAAADDEISFDPEDIITHIEKIDEGWWRGLCKGKYGLFPANYVQVNE